MKSLAPYPTPSRKQERIVHGAEVFANRLKKVTHGMERTIYPVTFFVDKHKRKVEARDWERRAQNVPSSELVPPEQEAVYVANNIEAMDQNFFYVLKAGRIWFKPIAAPKQAKWQLFGPDGLAPNGVKLTAITSDGRNLVAIGDGFVNYVHTDNIQFVVTDKDWQIADIRLDWTDRWFAVPIVNKVMGLFQERYLRLPPDWICVAISQKGPETGYYTDMSGKNQPEFLVGVTTLYVLASNGRIYFADPWLGNGFNNEITAPEDGQFIAQKMAVAASTIFLFKRDAAGNAQMYTRFADFDSTGSDPLLPASYNLDNKIPLVRYLPAEDWLKQPEIILHKKARLTGMIGILQTGRGQANRQLRVEGTNENGEPGYYVKNIYADKWQFEVTPQQSLEFLAPTIVNAPPPAPPVDLNGEIYIKNNPGLFQSVALKKYLDHGLNERGLHTTVELTLNSGKTISFPLYAKRSFSQLFGFRNNEPYWHLVLPKEYQLDNDFEVQAAIKAIFKDKTHIAVTVNELANGDIEVLQKHRRFAFAFSPMTVRHPEFPQLKNKLG